MIDVALLRDACGESELGMAISLSLHNKRIDSTHLANIHQNCSQLRSLDLSFNRISDISA